MCQACIEGELWAAYQCEMATRAAATCRNDGAPQDPATTNGELAAHAGSTSAPTPRAGATEPIRT